MKNKIILTAIIIITSLMSFSQKDSGDTLKPYWAYVPNVTYDENCYANGDNWTGDGNYSLPCELIDFSIISEASGTCFEWATMSETNASHFNISIQYPNGKIEKTENINAAGNSNSPRYYRTKSDLIYPKGSIVKLTQTDYDGKTHLMAIKSIDMKTEGGNITDFTIIKDQNNLTAIWKSNIDINTSVNIYSLDGRLLGIWSGSSNNGLNHSSSFTLDKGSTCIIVLETAYERQSIKTVL